MQSGQAMFFNDFEVFAAQIQNSDASNLVTLYSPAADVKIESLGVTSSDTSARDVSFVVTKGGVDYIIGSKAVPITAGQIAATPAVNLLDQAIAPFLRVDENGNTYLLLDSTCVLKAKALTTVTSTKVLQFFGTVRK